MAEEKTIFDEKPDFFYSYIKSVYYEDEELSLEENWERYWENWEKEYKIKRQFEKKYVNDELIEIAREALDNDGIVYGFNHYLKDKATKELYVIQTWDYVPDIRMIKARLLRRKQLGLIFQLLNVKGDKRKMTKDELVEYYAKRTKSAESYIIRQNKRIAELEEQIEKMKCGGNCKNEGDYKDLYDWRKSDAKLEEAKEIIEGLMRFCRCFAQHHTEDIRYKEAEEFLKEINK